MNSVFFGDCREIMRQLIGDGVKVQMCVTSPPYWGLRDYGVDGQLGLEPTPEEYVAHMVEVFELVRELLAVDGTLWLNLGDSYAGSWGAQSRGDNYDSTTLDGQGEKYLSARQIKAAPKGTKTGSLKNTQGLKPKDLIGLPWRVAFALQAAGWYLRSDIIWHKPNPMPESVTDRPTKAHEYLFLLSKNQRYYYDADAIAEKSTWFERDKRAINGASPGIKVQDKQDAMQSCGAFRNDGMRNKRSVWEVATKSYSDAHFATFPPKLIEPCILAGSRLGDIVIDPFFGSGTTGQVCEQLGRQWIGVELNESYKPLIEKRTQQTSLSFKE